MATRNDFLPISREDLAARGWEELDIILVTGDAYVDHPAYGMALIGRYLEHHGFKVGIIAQPDWRKVDDFTKLGKPRLFFGITAGNVDSMIANYTANKKIRRDDDYAPGGIAGQRPNRATIVYANRIREAYPAVPVVLGGIEASLRRLAHYDYWDDRVRRSLVVDAKADILVYGMGENAVLEIARRLQKNESLDNIPGTVVVRKNVDDLAGAVLLPSFETVAAHKGEFSQAFLKIYANMNPFSAAPLVQAHADRWVVQYPPSLPLSVAEMDALYALPYARDYHPVYAAQGGVPGIETVRWSLVSHRGCCGECSFCALYLHQGRIVQPRSIASLLQEARLLAADPHFGGTITDVGGPTANLYAAQCARWEKSGFCDQRKCLVPQKCDSLKIDYAETLKLYRELRKIPGVKHVFVGSGLRYDLLNNSAAAEYLEELCRHHVSGLLKIAPEHCCNEVLRLMGKPNFDAYEQFVARFKSAVEKTGKKSFIVNYLLVSHPGCSLREALNLALYLAKRHVKPEQIQDFIPTPMTYSACMYYTGKNPFTGKAVHVPRSERERRLQRALAQYNKSENKPLVLAALKELGAMHVAGKLFDGSGDYGARKEVKHGQDQTRPARHLQRRFRHR